jgi:hypothetical protein
MISLLLLLLNFLMSCEKNLAEQRRQKGKEPIHLKPSEEQTLESYQNKDFNLESCPSQKHLIANPGAFKVKVFSEIPQDPLQEKGKILDYGTPISVLTETQQSYRSIQLPEGKYWIREKWLACSDDFQSQETQTANVILVERAPEKTVACSLKTQTFRRHVPCVYRGFTLLSLEPNQKHLFFSVPNYFDGKKNYEYAKRPYCFVEENLVLSCDEES